MIEFVNQQRETSAYFEQIYQTMLPFLSPSESLSTSDTVTIQFCSDLHLEFGPSGTLALPKGKYLALLGGEYSP